MTIFEGEDDAYKPEELALYMPYEVVWKFNATPAKEYFGSAPCPPGMSPEECAKTQTEADESAKTQTEAKTEVVHQPWYTQEMIPNVPNWILAGGLAVVVGYLAGPFLFRKFDHYYSRRN